MITPEHDHALSYHPLVPGRAELHEDLRHAAKLYCNQLDAICPPSREASLAFTYLQESLMMANAAVAIHQDRLDLPETGPAMEPPDLPLALLCAAAAGREFTLDRGHEHWAAVFVHVDGRMFSTSFAVDSEVDNTLAQLVGHDLRVGTYQGEPAGAGEEIEIPIEQTTGDAVEKLTGRHPEEGK